jgi:catechol 2,3-dioxygenase-like lactoylglutathione lyase family enzyme
MAARFLTGRLQFPVLRSSLEYEEEEVRDVKTQRIDHVGVVVRDLPAAKAFFIELGLAVLGEGDFEGELFDQVTGLDGVKVSMAMLGTPDGEATIELSQYHSPPDAGSIQRPAANTLGIRHIAFVVDDIEAAIAKLKKHGAEPFGAIQQYENSYKLCYVRGPEGIIIELAEQLN